MAETTKEIQELEQRWETERDAEIRARSAEVYTPPERQLTDGEQPKALLPEHAASLQEKALRDALQKEVQAILEHGLTPEKKASLTTTMEQAGIPEEQRTELLQNLEDAHKGISPGIRKHLDAINTLFDGVEERVKASVAAYTDPVVKSAREAAEKLIAWQDAVYEGTQQEEPAKRPATTAIYDTPPVAIAGDTAEKPQEQPQQKEDPTFLKAVIGAVMAAVTAVISMVGINLHKDDKQEDKTAQVPETSAGGQTAASVEETLAPLPPVAPSFPEDQAKAELRAATAEPSSIANINDLEQKKKVFTERVRAEAADGARELDNVVFRSYMQEIADLAKEATSPEQLKVLQDGMDKLNEIGAGRWEKFLSPELKDYEKSQDRALDTVELAMRSAYKAAASHASKVEAERETAEVEHSR